MEMTADGVPVATDVFKSAIKSCRRFTYEEVDEYLAGPGGLEEETDGRRYTVSWPTCTSWR